MTEWMYVGVLRSMCMVGVSHAIKGWRTVPWWTKQQGLCVGLHQLTTKVD